MKKIIWYYLIPSLALGIVTFLVYWHTFDYAFHFDDLANISKYFAIRHNTFSSLFFSGTRWISYWLNALIYRINYINPFWFRFFDVLIHAGNAIFLFVALFWSCSRLPQGHWLKRHDFTIAALVSFLFALHPVQTQTVCYVIQGQLEGMAMASVLLLILGLCVHTFASNTYVKMISLAVSVLIAFLATGTKEIAIIAPVLLVIWDWFLIANRSWKSLRSRLLFHGLMAATIWIAYLYLLKPDFFIEVFGLTITAKNNQGNIITAAPDQIITPFYWLLSQCKILVHYMTIFFWPFGLSVEYDYKLVDTIFSLDFLIPAGLLAVLVYGIFILIKRSETLLAGIGLLWFFLSMFPRTSIIPSAELCVDYKTYVGSAGILMALVNGVVLLAVWIMPHMPMRLRSRSFGAAASLLLLSSFTYATWCRQKVWRSGIAFWADVIVKAPHKARGFNNFGVELSNAGKFEEALPYFQKAIELDPFYVDAINNGAVAYAGVENIDKAIELFEKSLKLNPLFPEGYNNIAGMYQKKGDFTKAEKALLMAVKLRPHYGKAWYNLGLLYVEQEKMPQAWDCLRKCCYDADFDDDTGFHAFAKASIQLQKYDDAISAYHTLLKRQPRNGEVAFHLANAYFLAGQYDQSLSLYHQLLQASPDDPRLLINIGENYCEKGEPANALMYFGRLEQCKHQIPSICVRLARCYRDLGQHDKARSLIAECYALNPSPTILAKAQELQKTLS